MKIVGIQKGVTFKMDNVTFSGLNLFGVYQREGVEGVATDKIFVNVTKPFYGTAVALKVGDEVQLGYNRFGKVEAIVPVPASK